VTSPIQIPERGDILLEPATWRELAAEQGFWRLVDRKIVKLTQTGPGSVRLSGMGYVGRARVGRRDILLVEKTPGALSALLAYATGSAFRVAPVPASSSELGPLAELIIQEFGMAVRRYASAGREWVYRRQRESGSLVGGRVDVTASIKLRARGLGHRVVFDRWVAYFATDVNRIIAAALAETERIAAAVGMSGDALSDVRALGMLFADCRDTEVLFGSRARLSEMADRLSTSASPVVADVLALASVILSHESFELHTRSGGAVPRSWFVSLQTLYEVAVRRTLGTIVGKTASCRPGKIDPPPIFSAEEGKFTANPDLVIDGRDRWIGDVKYKTWPATADVSDLYQLLVHAVAHRSKVAFLVYADEQYEAQDLGVTRDGIRTLLFAADPRQLHAHLSRAVATLAGAAIDRAA
jgi:5-methylcytosine-specific restriction endonuclease McrBC regulatory subunit McrC